MYLMLQQAQSDDYVIATWESYKLAELIEVAFRLVGLDWREYVGQ
jgi:GDPmannose 4,6-dehydratase